MARLENLNLKVSVTLDDQTKAEIATFVRDELAKQAPASLPR
jgi:hypothetical protein